MSSDNVTPRLLSQKKAAAYLGISPRTLATRIREGRIPTVRMSPRCVKIDRDDLDGYITSMKQGGPHVDY